MIEPPLTAYLTSAEPAPMQRLTGWLVLLMSIATLPAAATAGNQDDAWLDSHTPELLDLYKHLHTHPELSFKEVNTSQRIAEELRKAGAQVTTGVGKLGVVGVMVNGKGPTVLVRTDLDALPV